MAEQEMWEKMAEAVAKGSLFSRFAGRVGRETSREYEEGKTAFKAGMEELPSNLVDLMMPGVKSLSAGANVVGTGLSGLRTLMSPWKGLSQSLAQTPIEEGMGPTAEKVGFGAGFASEVGPGLLSLLRAGIRHGAPIIEKGLKTVATKLKGAATPEAKFLPGAYRKGGPYPMVPKSPARAEAERVAQDLPTKVPQAAEGAAHSPYSRWAEAFAAEQERLRQLSLRYPGEKEIYASLRGLPGELRKAFTGKGSKPLEFHKSRLEGEGSGFMATGELFAPTHPMTAAIKRRNPAADVIATGKFDPNAALYEKAESVLRHEGVHALLSPGRLPESIRGKLLEDAMNVASMFPRGGSSTIGEYVRGVWGKPIFKYYRELAKQKPQMANEAWLIPRAEMKYTEGLAQAIAPGKAEYAAEIPLEARTAAIEALRMANKRMKAHRRQQRAQKSAGK